MDSSLLPDIQYFIKNRDPFNCLSQVQLDILIDQRNISYLSFLALFMSVEILKRKRF